MPVSPRTSTIVLGMFLSVSMVARTSSTSALVPMILPTECFFLRSRLISTSSFLSSYRSSALARSVRISSRLTGFWR